MSGMNGTVSQAVEGDREAFARLYDAYSRPVYLTLVGILRAREDAEDALQAAFLAAWQRLPTLRRHDRFVPWLFRIARNKAKDAARRQRDRLLSDSPVEDLIDPSLGAAARDEMDRALASLKPDSRVLVLLRAVHGWSAEEVAAAVGKSPATVRRRYARALAHLKSRLGDGVRHDG